MYRGQLQTKNTLKRKRKTIKSTSLSPSPSVATTPTLSNRGKNSTGPKTNPSHFHSTSSTSPLRDSSKPSNSDTTSNDIFTHKRMTLCTSSNTAEYKKLDPPTVHTYKKVLATQWISRKESIN